MDRHDVRNWQLHQWRLTPILQPEICVKFKESDGNNR